MVVSHLVIIVKEALIILSVSLKKGFNIIKLLQWFCIAFITFTIRIMDFVNDKFFIDQLQLLKYWARDFIFGQKCFDLLNLLFLLLQWWTCHLCNDNHMLFLNILLFWQDKMLVSLLNLAQISENWINNLRFNSLTYEEYVIFKFKAVFLKFFLME